MTTTPQPTQQEQQIVQEVDALTDRWLAKRADIQLLLTGDAAIDAHTDNYRGLSDGVVKIVFTHLEAAKREVQKIDGNTSDGYHTFNELYHYRMLYNALLFNEWAKLPGNPYDVHKSYYHSDGQPCFGGGWFVVVAETPAGQITNHYENKHWSVFQITRRQTANKWDGATPQDVAERLAQLAKPTEKDT